MNWIKVEDRLPEIESSVLIFATYNYEFLPKQETISIGYITDLSNGDRCWFNESFNDTDFIVTHWMLLPKKPVERCPLMESENCHC